VATYMTSGAGHGGRHNKKLLGLLVKPLFFGGGSCALRQLSDTMELAKVVSGNEERMQDWMATTGDAEAIVAREGGQTLQGTWS
jgi:hypothetical protein